MAPVLSPDKQNPKQKLKQNEPVPDVKDVKVVTATSTSKEEEEEEPVYTLLDFDLDVIPERYGMMCTRIFDIFKVKLHTKGSKCGCDGEMCAIWGLVQVVDEETNARYDVYNRKPTDPEKIQCDGDLLLAGFPVIQLSKLLQVLVKLYCKCHNAVIADGSFYLDYFTSPYKFNKVIVKNVCGEHGWVSVSHITFEHASIAHVEEIVVEGNHDADINLFGTVAMYLQGTHADVFAEYSQIFLFDNLLRNSAPVKYNHSIKLSRSFLVVPNFHSLKIQLVFHDHTGAPKISKDIILEVNRSSLFEERVDENSIIKLRIEWQYFDARCPRERNLKQKLSAKQIFLSDIDSVDFETEVRTEGPSTVALITFDNCSFVEVFSVLPCTQDNDVDIHGTIKLIDSSNTNVCTIFEGNEKCCKSKPLNITCYPYNCDCTDDGYRIQVDLKGKRGSVGEGKVYWNESRIKNFTDELLCSIFKGDMGYVAIHYCMIRRSVIACITTSFVEISQGPQVSLNVFGNIKAGYEGYEYATIYDREFYRSTLFSRNSDEWVEVVSGSGLPLSKRVMAVPEDDSLILDVKLKVKLGEDTEFETVEKEVSFKPYAPGLYTIDVGNCALSICIHWSYGEDPNPDRMSHSIIPDKRTLRKAMQRGRGR